MGSINYKFFEEFLNNHTGNYEIEIEEKLYSIPVKTIIDFITSNEQKYFEYMITPPLENISSTHFRYAVLSFFRKYLRDSTINLGTAIEDRLDDIWKDTSVQNVGLTYKNNDPNLKKVNIDPSLREAILKDMPNYGNLDSCKALYIYIKMCKLLTYDEEFFVLNQQGEAAKKHEDINHIQSITPSNNKVVCYEFAAIYEFLLTELGIPCEIIKGSNDLDTYGKEHVYVRIKIDENIFDVDSTTSIFTGDLFAAKLDLKLNGFNEVNGRMMMKEFISMVYDDVNGNNKNRKFYDALSLYQTHYDNNQTISLEEKIKLLIDKANSSKLTGMDYIAYLLYLKKNVLFDLNFSKMLNINIIRYNAETGPIPIVVFTINGKDNEKPTYYTYLPKKELVNTTIEELQSKFDSNELSYISGDEKRTINGIKK